MPNDGVIKTLRNVAILVTVIVLILEAVIKPAVLLYPGEYVFLLIEAFLVGLPFYILVAFAKRRLKSDERAGIQTAYLSACGAGLGMIFLFVAYAVYIFALSLGGPIAAGLSFFAVVLASPVISGTVMFTVFRLTLLLRRKANERDANGEPKN